MDTLIVMLQTTDFKSWLLPKSPMSCIEPEMFYLLLEVLLCRILYNFACWACYPEITKVDIWAVITSVAGCQEHPSGRKWAKFKTYTKDKKQPKRDTWGAPKSPVMRKFTWPLTKCPQLRNRQLAVISLNTLNVSLTKRQCQTLHETT